MTRVLGLNQIRLITLAYRLSSQEIKEDCLETEVRKDHSGFQTGAAGVGRTLHVPRLKVMGFQRRQTQVLISTLLWVHDPI